MDATELREYVFNVYSQLLTRLKPEGATKARLAYNRFKEYLDRLDARYSQAELAEHSLKPGGWHPDSPGNDENTLHNLQMNLVDKTEAYHEHLYSSLAALAMLLNHLAPPSFKRGLPISSISKFLVFLESRIRESERDSDRGYGFFDDLKKSIEFRNQFAVHPQQHIVHDWMTQSTEDVTAIIYFVPVTDCRSESQPELPDLSEKTIEEIFNPYHPKFKFVHIPNKSFYIAPKLDKSQESFYELIFATLAATIGVDQSNRLKSLRGARGIWRDRDDLPDFAALRQEFDGYFEYGTES